MTDVFLADISNSSVEIRPTQSDVVFTEQKKVKTVYRILESYFFRSGCQSQMIFGLTVLSCKFVK